MEWEVAWQNHVANWKSPCEDSNVMSSQMVKRMNEAKFDTTYHTWSDDHFTVCHTRSGDLEWIHLIKDDEMVPLDINETAVTSFHGVEFDHPGFQYSEGKKRRLPCILIGSDREEQTFHVALFQILLESRIPELPKARILQIRRDVPASEVEFINRPFRSDMHWKGAFRHPVKIPDEVFPLLWRDIV